MVLFASALLSKFSLQKAKDKIAGVNSILSGGSGESWIPLSRQQATLPVSTQIRSRSVARESGKCTFEGKSLSWIEFAWPPSQLDDCMVHKLSWRFYESGLITLELEASKDAKGLDTRDLIGHRIELRDRTGFLVGTWSAAFTLYEGTEHIVFHTSATDDFPPLKLHFDEIAEWQDGVSFKL